MIAKKERPILFSAPMVRALLAGHKTMTRRVVKPQPYIANVADDSMRFWNVSGAVGGRIMLEPDFLARCPYGQPGDRLWVRETHSIFQTHGQHRPDDKRWGPWGGLPTSLSPDGTQIAYFREGFDRADPGRWRPSIHMPRWASRLTLEITGVRVEQLLQLSYEDAVAEGVVRHQRRWYANDEAGMAYDVPQGAFSALWEAINGAGSWHANPWVWVVEFKRLEQPHV